MMIRLWIVFILLAVVGMHGIIAGISQSSTKQITFKEPDNELDGFIGKVKSINIEIEEHEFTTHFLDFANRYKRKLFQTTQFDRDGRKVEKFNYRTDGVPMPKTTYSYDKSGGLLKESHYSAVSGQPYLETLYTYGPSGHLMEVIGKNIEKDKTLSRKTYSHDEKRNYTEVTEYDWNEVVRSKVGYVWNEKGGLTEVIGLSKDGETLGKGLFSYDEKGNVVEATFASEDESRPKKAKYSYDFDRQGNWVKRVLYHWVTEENKSFYKLMSITYRTIAYY